MKIVENSPYKMLHYQLEPGEYYLTKNKEVIETVAGKTLAIALYHKELKMGGVTNFIIPGNITTATIEESEISEVGIGYIEFLLADIVKSGGRRDQLTAKIFGASAGGGNSDYHISNIKFIKNYFKNEGISIIAEDLGREYYHKILFLPQSGELFSKRVTDTSFLTTYREIESIYVDNEVEFLTKKTEFVIF